MKQTGTLDYLELAATGGTLDSGKAYYSAAVGWTFTDYGPTYSAIYEGLKGGFDTEASEASAKALPMIYSEDLEGTLAEVESAGGRIVPIFSFPGGRLDPAGNELAIWGEQLAT